MVVAWQRPVYPPELAVDKSEGNVTVRIVVDDRGNVVRARVLQSFGPAADEAALKDIRDWKFKPAFVADRAAYCSLDVDIPFRPFLANEPLPRVPTGAELPREVKASFPVPIFMPSPNYPPELAGQHDQASVRVVLLVDNQGKVVESETFSSIESGFRREAQLAANLWTFKPAHQGEIDVPALFEADLIFTAH